MLCPHCGYINTDADTACQSCGKELYSHGPGYSGESKGTPVKEPPSKPKSVPAGKATSPVVKKPEKKEKEPETKFIQGTLIKLLIIIVIIAGIVGVFYMFSKKYGKKKDPEEKAFQEMIKSGKDSINPKLHLKRARYYLDRKQYEKAIYDIDRAIKLDNNYHEAYFERGKFFLTVKNDPGSAIDSFNRAIEIEPGNVEYILNRGMSYDANDNVFPAIYDFTRYIKARPDMAIGYLNRGKVFLYKRKDIEKALANLEKAYKLDAQSQTIKDTLSDAYYKYGNSLKKKGKKFKPIEYFEKSVNVNPENVNARNEIALFKYNKAIELISKKNNRGAIVILSESVKVKPDFIKGFIKRAELYDTTGERDNAINDYQKAYDLNSQNIEVKSRLLKLLIHRAKERKEKGEKDLALSDYSRIIAIDNKNAQAFLQRGLINYSKESYQSAVEDLSKAIELNPEISDNKITKPLTKSCYEFGKILESKQNYKEAAKQYRKALKLNGNYKPAKEALKGITN